jgi:hypothetical protein
MIRRRSDSNDPDAEGFGVRGISHSTGMHPHRSNQGSSHRKKRSYFVRDFRG